MQTSQFYSGALAFLSRFWTSRAHALTRISFGRLVHLLWNHLDDELLGFGRRPIRCGTFVLMCRNVIHCTTLGSALHRAHRTYALLQEDHPHFRLEREDDTIHLVIDDTDLDDPEHFAAETMIMGWHRFCSWLIKRQIPLREVCFNYPAPAHSKEYHLMFGAPLRFDAGQTAFTFSASYLEEPVLQDIGSLRAFLQKPAEVLLSRREYGNLLSTRIRRVLAQDAGGSALELRTVAARLGTSPQTLRRHLLQNEGLGFLAVKNQWRRDLSISLLTETTLSTDEIAERVGFSAASALHHAFKKWTGLSLSTYRS